jgi:hypothetical protein
MMKLEFVTALIAKNRFLQIFAATVRAGARPRFIFHLMTAAGAEPGTGRQILTAFVALIENHLLVSALRAEF